MCTIIRSSMADLVEAMDEMSSCNHEHNAHHPSVNRNYGKSNRSLSSRSSDEYDRRFALDSVERDAARVWTTLPKKYRLEKDFVLAALKSTSIPGKSEFERTFPQSLRFDRDIVLAFTDRRDFEQLYYTRHLFVPDCLTGDKEVMMAYCRKIPRALQECTEDLCNDRDVVMAAISFGGLELQYASRRLQEDKELVIAACQKDGRALEFCPPGPTRIELTNDRDFMLSVLANNGGAMLRLVAEPLRRDPALLLEALAHGMRYRQIPDPYKHDKAFLLKAISRNSKLYLEISPLYRDADFALAAATAPDSNDEIHHRAIELAPQLKGNRDVVMAIAQRGDKDLLESLLNGGGSQQFLDDKPIMLAAINRDCRLFKYVRARLREDPEIIMAGIQQESAIDTLRDISPETRRRFPEICIKAIQVTGTRRLRYLESIIPEGLWLDRDVVLAWVNKGGSILEHFQGLLVHDRELALAVAGNNWANFNKVGGALRNDRDFMMQAVQEDGRVLRFASRVIQGDYSVLVRAVANHHRALSGVMVAESEFKAWIKNALDLHMTFVKDFLRGIAINKAHVAPALRCQLPMLDRGVETSQAFKQLIADFLGVPVKEDLRLMRQAWTNLTYPPCNAFVDSSDRADVMGEELENMVNARRHVRFARRLVADQPENDIGHGLEAETHRQRRDALHDRVLAARRRREAAFLFGPDQDAALDGEDDDDDMEDGDDELMHMEDVREAFAPGAIVNFAVGPVARRVPNPLNRRGVHVNIEINNNNWDGFNHDNNNGFVMNNDIVDFFNNNNGANDQNINDNNGNNGVDVQEGLVREHFFALLQQWDDM